MKRALKYLLGLAIAIAAVSAFMSVCCLGAAFATDIPRALTGGTVEVKIRAVEGADSADTKSVSSQVVGSGLQVFCADVANPTDTVVGTTDIIPKTAAVVRLEGFAWTGVGCTGVASAASVDIYTIAFGPPLAPILE